MLYLSSGRAALWLILKTLSSMSPKKREPIIPAYTCPAVVSALLKADLRPVLCDINNADFGFSGQELQQKINKNTLAVMIVHLFGYPANIEEVKGCCKQNNLFVIEDAAQAFGNTLLNSPARKLGLLGDAGFFSFGRGKPVSLSYGGIFATKSEEIFTEAKKIVESIDQRNGVGFFRYMLRMSSYSLFSNPHLYWIPQGIPFFHLGETVFKPDFIISPGIGPAASLFAELLPTIKGERKIREENSSWYFQEFQDIPWVEKAPRGDFPYLRYPLLIKGKNRRDLILSRLLSEGTGASLFYPMPLNELPGLKELLNDSATYPNAKKLSESLITLPVHSGVSPSHREKILNIILKASKQPNELE